MRVLVFGGSGFLGSHVADALSEAGHMVTVFDIKPSPYLRNDQMMVTGDVLDMNLVEDVIKNHEIVYHFAGIADIDECVTRPIDTVKFNILGTVQILEACQRYKIKRFIFASSVSLSLKNGLRNTAANSISRCGLSRTFNRHNTSLISVASKYPAVAWQLTGTPESRNISTYSLAFLAKERISTTMSRYSTSRIHSCCLSHI